jgi:small neutral amino acid transporter SnatA (MarC family)
MTNSTGRQPRMAERARAVSISAIAVLTFVANAHAQGSSELPASRIPDLSQVFILFFVMLGPIKIIAPFAVMTKEVEEKSRRKLAIHAFAIASVTTPACCCNRPRHSGQLARVAGRAVDLFLVALRQVLQQYDPATEAEARQPESALAAMAIRLAFPTIVTPYGIAAVILLLSVSPNAGYMIGVAAALIGVMVLNLLAMLYARQILKTIGLIPLQIVGTVLSVMQVALGVQMMIGGLRLIGVLQ